MHILNQELYRFDYALPIYNWYYPLFNRIRKDLNSNLKKAYHRLETTIVRSRGLYFHIPFCSSICSFCPFVKNLVKNVNIVEDYTKALIREIELKASYESISGIPIGAIFFGGGSPSVLSSNQILRIGDALKNNFDLSKMKEFSFEMSINDLSSEKMLSIRKIGVTHSRIGVQTFNPIYRKIFNLKTPLKTIVEVAQSLKKIFPYVSFDMLCAIDGQTIEEFSYDLKKAIDLGLSNIAFYPINNVVTPINLHQKFEKEGLQPLSGQKKLLMNVFLNDFMRANSFLPHNGHEYVKVNNEEAIKEQVLTRNYSFLYHKYVYGYHDYEVIGFGLNALSIMNHFVANNTQSREQYVEGLLKKNVLKFTIGEHEEEADYSKGIILHLPYHGYIEKQKIQWKKVNTETLKSLNQLKVAGLVSETENEYKLTHDGWNWYVNLMYYLSPAKEQRILDQFIEKKSKEKGRRLGNNTIPTKISK